MSNPVGGVVGGAISGVGHLISGAVGGVSKFIGDELQKLAPKPDLQTPNIPTAQQNQAAASNTAVQTQLTKEQNARSSATILTSPAGLTDEPTTTSSLLTGV